MSFEVILLGTGYPVPQEPDRAGPATLVKVGGMHLLFDAGRGLLMRLRGASSGPLFVHTVFLTHLHSDHITDFNDLVTMQWAMNFSPKPLPVIGPPGTQGFCDDTLRMLRKDIAWRIEHHANLRWEPDLAVTEVLEGVAFEENGVRITAARTHHPPVDPSIGYRIDHGGRSVVIAGDTLPCDGLFELCEDADVYVQTVLRRPLIEGLGFARLTDILDYHTSTEDAAKVAARCGVKKLVFTHMMPTPAPGTEQDWINDAKQHFDGEIIVGEDLQTIELRSG